MASIFERAPPHRPWSLYPLGVACIFQNTQTLLPDRLRLARLRGLPSATAAC
ncbi:hypothetical protein GQ53DRAFT_741362 [Thozetella sp. PMI_491]|nr:hypothetical protein GQ53DRAFT_741362 [Thozetella sp. PMI_491]